MSDIFASDSKTNATEYTVSEISGALKRTVEDAFGNVRVRGEISGYRGPHSSGHAYFALKDDKARLEAVVWKGTMSRLKFRPEEGMEVIATGRLTTFPGSSKYQIVIDNLEPAGAGALMALLEERKRRLAGEGLFEESRKRRLPYMPCVIGVVTSPTGAVIRDIVHRIRDRFPLHVVVWPVRVQGETSGSEVSAAIAGFNALPDTWADSAARCADRRARRGQPGGPVGLQRRGAGAGRRRIVHSGNLGSRSRNRLDADRFCCRQARANTDGSRRNRSAGEGRSAGDARQSGRAAAGMHVARTRQEASDIARCRASAPFGRSTSGSSAPSIRRGNRPA